MERVFEVTVDEVGRGGRFKHGGVLVKALMLSGMEKVGGISQALSTSCLSIQSPNTSISLMEESVLFSSSLH